MLIIVVFYLRTTFAGGEGKQTGDPNLKFQDELEAYTEYKATAHFTPHPGKTNTYCGLA